ncbi:MAG TPA: RNase J family beta-CASP ribonuclease [Ruminococcaceae bacterium]|nr:RNase J family beta-CASP ribonuclease [Oscillospiraceae bacterium]
MPEQNKNSGFSAKRSSQKKDSNAAEQEKPRIARSTKSAKNKKTNDEKANNANIDSGKTALVKNESGTEPKKQAKAQPKEIKRTPVKIIPLGGLNEIGKNMTLYECGSDIFIVDCGLAFPDEDMLGIDLVIPDFTYIEKNIDKVRGIVVTHGHEDHIGGLPYLLKNFNIPVFATKLTIGLVEGKLKEHGLTGKVALNVVKPRQIIKMGCMAVEFIRVNHSIPDACGMAIHTPAGIIIQTGDFKIDYTPIEGEIIDLARFGELGSRGVLALLSDSTNAERPGSTASEKTVGESFEKLFSQAKNRRIIIASFASNIHRIQQIVDSAKTHGRKVAVSGRSMVNVVAIAVELGYLSIPEGLLIDIETLNRYTDDQLVIITTGSQGEPMSALSRMAMGDHRKVQVTPNDYIIISATPIPGNEKLVGKVINELMRQGAEVIYEKMYDVHVSGHACQDELRLMLGLTRPKFFIPVHGEYKHLKKHASLAQSMGIPSDRILIGEIGKVMELDGVSIKFNGIVPAGKVFVDGLGVGDVGSVVLRDRKHLGQDGLIIIVATIDSATGELLAGPDIVSRGFVYVRESEDMINEAKDVARSVFNKCNENNIREWGNIKQQVKDAVSDFLYIRTKRKPMILPVIQEV